MKNILFYVFLLIAGCSPEIVVRSDYDKGVNMKQYSTYKWANMDELESGNNPLYYNELTDRRIRGAVNAELQSRGYTQVGDQVELVIHYHIIVENQGMIRNDPYGNYGMHWMRSQSLVQYKEGSIIIDIMEATTNNLAWRGWATSVIDEAIQIDEELIEASISKIFRKYPWRASSQRQESEETNPSQ